MIARPRAQAAQAARDERGIGLVELLVSMLLLGIVSLIVSGLYISTMRTVDQTRTLTANTREVSNGMNQVARVIRAGTENPVKGQALSSPAFVSATKESLTIYAYVNLRSSDEQPIKVEYKLDDQRRLIETQWTALRDDEDYFTFGEDASEKSSRIIAETVAPRSSEAAEEAYLFSYLTADGTELPVPASGAFTTAQLRSIAAVKVTMTLQASMTDAQSAVTLQNTVGMPNLPLAEKGL